MRTTEEHMAASAMEIANRAKSDYDSHLADYDRRLETWKPQLAKYYTCNKSASRVVAAQVGDPVSLAIAARNLCKADEAVLRKAVYATYADNPAFGNDAMEKVRNIALENNTGEIVAYRAKMNSPATIRPKETAPSDHSI
jgi:hypothetical protein